MRERINEIQKIFTEDEVKALIKEYIYCDGEFYRKIYDSEFNTGNEETETNLDMIPKAITKYILDNVIEFIEYCDNRQVRVINDIRKLFEKEIDYAMMKIDKLSENNEERKKYENYKHAYGQNINLWQSGYGIHIVLVRELIKPLKQFMEENSQRALPEIITNYRNVIQAHEISESNEENEKTLEELENELQKLQRQEKRTTQQRDASKLLKNAYQAELQKEDEES